MPISFQLKQFPSGFSLNTAAAGETVEVIFRELVGPKDAHLADRLEQLHGCLFSKIPGFPHPFQIHHLLVVVNADLSATAYVNELDMKMTVKSNRSIKSGEDVYVNDISDIPEVDVGVSIPVDAAFVVVQSFGWRRSVFYDFGPLAFEKNQRVYRIEDMLAQQTLVLFGLKQMLPQGVARIAEMENSLKLLQALLDSNCEEESKYQQILTRSEWMLAGNYSQLLRHAKMDDINIPDFTAVRCYDGCHDVIELKHPFLKLFKSDGNLSAEFNDAWNQAERYLDFCVRQRAYLQDQKKLFFENPRCVLIIGYNLTEDQKRHILMKQGMNKAITVFTYDQLVSIAKRILRLVKDAGDGVQPGLR
ncbi:MAG TPA: Shedu anti-phage system protein SduA domain-containing protein [Verrucomicrobiae bacterium]